ncbi:UDP-glucose-4-epimerase [Orbilia brochopaga]|uniref:UDP-glucose 4-epimerase n=1 Tax=Orbilia brochopaga TaxID=3140254 RepID=A0AAV9U4V8_9PEZI
MNEQAARETVLITGGTGYIGSFTSLELLVAGYNVVIVDNLYNSSEEAIHRIELICGVRPAFYKVDVTDREALDSVFERHPEISSVIHFAALKSVGESSEVPAEYYRVNVGGTAILLSAMKKHNVHKIVFSSSATVYGDVTRFSDMIPIPETCPLEPTNPYGRTKWFNEMVIADHVAANEGAAAALLRYFNPCGAHPSGILGEDPQGVPYNLLPLLGQVAVGKREKLQVFGTDYASHDGTAIRDYIHIVDLAQGHIAALKKLYDPSFKGCKAWNLGTGRGSTVFDILKAFSKAVGRELPYEVAPRRPGDVLDLTAKPGLAREELGWWTKKTLEDACEDLWLWVKNNPSGYREEYKPELLAQWKSTVQQDSS